MKIKTRRNGRLHLDKRAARLAVDPGGGDDLLTTQQLAVWLGVSTQWIEQGRTRGYGPPYERLSPKFIRYRREKVRAWLDERSHTATAEYAAANVRRGRRAAA